MHTALETLILVVGESPTLKAAGGRPPLAGEAGVYYYDVAIIRALLMLYRHVVQKRQERGRETSQFAPIILNTPGYCVHSRLSRSPPTARRDEPLLQHLAPVSGPAE